MSKAELRAILMHGYTMARQEADITMGRNETFPGIAGQVGRSA